MLGIAPNLLLSFQSHTRRLCALGTFIRLFDGLWLFVVVLFVVFYLVVCLPDLSTLASSVSSLTYSLFSPHRLHFICYLLIL
jgi:hypothetical protein